MWTDAKGRCANKGDQNKTNNIKKFKYINHPVYESENENVLQL